MEFYQAAVLFGAVAIVALLASRIHLPFFLALLLGALFFALFANMTLPSIGDTFSLGFAQTIDSLGLVIIAGCAASAFLARSGVAARIPPDGRSSRAAIGFGLVFSLTPSAPVALALMRPWCLAAAGADTRSRAATVVTLTLALTAGQAFIYPSIYAVATRAILKVDLMTMVAVGIALAVATAVAGWLFVRWMVPRGVAEAPRRAPAKAKRRFTAADLRHAVVPTLVPLLFLIAAGFAQIPSEPLGRGVKEFLVFMARPAVVLTLSLGLSLLMLRRWDKTVVAQSGWLGEALAASVQPLLAVGASGGFVSLLQATGMAELIAERITFLHLGIAIPFLAAAALKTLQGSALVATLTAAGLTEPLLNSLGLGDPFGHALAAAAIGAGTLIVHVNDPLFWLVADMAELSPLRTLALHTLATLVQALTAVVLLVLLRAAVI